MKIDCQETLEDLPPQHKAVFDQTESISYECSFGWFENLISTTLGPEESLKVYSADDEQGQIAILPMYYRPGSSFKPALIRSLSNFYTSLYAPIASNGATEDLLAQALLAIKNSPLAWDAIHFNPLSLDHDSFAALYKALKSHGFITFKYFCFVNWHMLVNGRSYDEYFNGLPSRLKNTVKRKRKQFLATGGARLEIVTDGDKLDLAIADYTKVYNVSWKVQEPFPEFMPGLIKLCAAKGWLRLGIAYINDQPIAAQLWIIAHGRAAIYKLAHDEKFDSFSIGSVLTAHMMQHAIDSDKVFDVDYLIGDDTYKKDWMSHRRERFGIVAYNPKTLLGLTGALKQALGEAKRKALTHWNPS
jgi:hypothetical protein